MAALLPSGRFCWPRGSLKSEEWGHGTGCAVRVCCVLGPCGAVWVDDAHGMWYIGYVYGFYASMRMSCVWCVVNERSIFLLCISGMCA